MTCKYKYKDKWYSESEVKIQILRDISLNEVIVELTTQMSYTVEINTTKEPLQDYEMVDTTGEGDFNVVEFIPDTELILEEDEDGNVISTKEVLSEKGKRQIQEREDKRKPTQHYSNLTVPGGTKGSYREVNIESPLITLPKSHAQFNTEHTLMFSRMDDAQTYSEIDIEKLISLMKNSGQLEIKCS